MGKILVVDNDLDIPFILRTFLAKHGYTVNQANSGEECLEVLKKEWPDLIFMDIMMPGLDGWETARKIKTDPKTKHIPISMLSVKCELEDKVKSRDYSLADEHLCKPVDFDCVTTVARAFVKRKD
jgi:CheY-like chemotaxis protein